MTRVRLIVSPRGETRAHYLRNLFFAKLARDVEILFAVAQGVPATQFQRFWDTVRTKKGGTAIYAESDWRAELEILEDFSDSERTRYKLKVLRTLAASKIHQNPKDGHVFHAISRRDCEGEFCTLTITS